jgi:hypothetical protein
VPLLKEKKPPPAKSLGRKSPVFYDRIHGWIKFQRAKKRRPSKSVRELKREVHNAVEYFKDEIKAGLS